MKECDIEIFFSTQPETLRETINANKRFVTYCCVVRKYNLKLIYTLCKNSYDTFNDFLKIWILK